MARGSGARKSGKPIGSYDHSGAERVNNPPVGLVTARTDPDGQTQSYRHATPGVIASEAARQQREREREREREISGPPESSLSGSEPHDSGLTGPGGSEPHDLEPTGPGGSEPHDPGLTRPGGSEPHDPHLGPGGRPPPPRRPVLPSSEPYDEPHDPHLDPELVWSGKTELSWADKVERNDFEVATVSLHVHERNDPRSIIEAVRRPEAGPGQESLFELPDENPPLRQAIEFYRHAHNWSNRLIAGDSLLVMNSLLHKEGMGGDVQTVYIDPPYGIKYGSNFQPFTNKREVTDGKDTHLTGEPETIKAFRDTWELGIHSYLSYLRDRLLLARELMAESGSCFVQIGDENIHRVALVMDEVFGCQNRMATITYATSGSSATKHLPEVCDYLLWYAKDRSRVKYLQLYEQLDRVGIVGHFSSYLMVELSDGSCRKLTTNERFDPDEYLPEGSRLFRATPLTSQGTSTTGRSKPYRWEGRIYLCPETSSWRVSESGMDRLAENGRLFSASPTASLQWKWYEDEVPGRRINNIWHRPMSTSDKRYVVQTANSVIQRCILMTSDPGDLVFDPTCGSGTTAYVAEQWGRRWITCDTSRVALALARQRLMTANFDYYTLAHPDEGVGSGFVYEKVPKVSAASLAYDEPPQHTVLYDRPERNRAKHRVTGPFTVEAVPAPTVLSLDAPLGDLAATDAGREVAGKELPADNSVARTGETARHTQWIDELKGSGVRAKWGQRISFTRLEPLATPYLHAVGEAEPGSRRAAVAFGPEHAPLEPRRVELAIEQARTLVPEPDLMVFAAFQFDPEAAKDIDETDWPGVELLRAEMNSDLQTDDLKGGRTANESFWLVGQPEVEATRLDDGRWRVEVLGFDYFDVSSGEHVSGDAEEIAVWMLDTDYDGRSLFPHQVFFPSDGRKGGWDKLAKALKASLDTTLMSAYAGTVSLPFEAGVNRRAAVKIVDTRGIESLRVVDLA